MNIPAISAEVPQDFCPSDNSHGLRKDGKWYLDGGCLTAIVNAKYPNRADAETTQKYFVALKAQQSEEKLEELKKEGPSVWMEGTGGSLTVTLDKKTNEVVITHAKEWANKAQEWRVPFVPEQWVDVNPYDLQAIQKAPFFASATEREIPVKPSGTTFEPVRHKGSFSVITNQGFSNQGSPAPK